MEIKRNRNIWIMSLKSRIWAVYASHGYERSHIADLANIFDLVTNC